MSRRDSDWVAGHFDAHTVDRTPVGAENDARVLFASFLREPEITQRCAAILGKQELSRAERFLSPEAEASFGQRRAFRRYCGAVALGSRQPLADIAFRETEKGRPYLPSATGHSFSFSASRSGFLGAWSRTHKVGVDFEDKSRSLEAVELAERYFSSAEAQAVRGAEGTARVGTFYRLWCLKEAALKSIGEGLPFGLDAFQFELTPRPNLARVPREHGAPTRFKAFEIEGAQFCGALVMKSGPGSPDPVHL